MRSAQPYFSYYWRVTRRAWRDTWAFTKRQGLVAGTAAALLGSWLYAWLEGEVKVVPILIGGVGGLVAFTGLWFVFQLALAPARLDFDGRRELKDQADQFTAFLGHKRAIDRAYGSNIAPVPSLAAASRQIGTELLDIRHKIEMVKSTRPHPHYSHGFRLPGARWDEYAALLADDPKLYGAVERAYVAAHHVNEALAMRETRAKPEQTLGVISDDGLDAAYDAAADALDALGEFVPEPWESGVDRSVRLVTEDALREFEADKGAKTAT